MIQDILKEAVDQKVSDIFLVAGRPVSFYKNGVITKEGNEALSPDDVDENVRAIYELAKRDYSRLLEVGDDDFSLSVAGLSRFRVSAYKQRGTASAVLRVISFKLPDPKEFSIPENIVNLGNQPNGMVLVTGPAGSGKSSTLACIIDHINQTQESHVITLEDPIEYLHRSGWTPEAMWRA